jgi:hypothetical protein
LCWHSGGSQGDIAKLKGEDVDWKNGTGFLKIGLGIGILMTFESDLFFSRQRVRS